MPARFRDILLQIAETDAVIGVHHKEETSAFFEIRTGEGRSQIVMVSLDVADDGEELVHMMSEIGPADPKLYATMLERNLNLRYSRIAILDNASERSFALVFAYPFAELQAVELAKAFGEIAFMADGIERACFNVDIQ